MMALYGGCPFSEGDIYKPDPQLKVFSIPLMYDSLHKVEKVKHYNKHNHNSYTYYIKRSL